jgi:hypothetical protein
LSGFRGEEVLDIVAVEFPDLFFDLDELNQKARNRRSPKLKSQSKSSKKWYYGTSSTRSLEAYKFRFLSDILKGNQSTHRSEQKTSRIESKDTKKTWLRTVKGYFGHIVYSGTGLGLF